MRQRRPGRVPRPVGEIEPEGLPGLQRDLAVGEGPDPQLGALEVHEDADRAPALLLDRANHLVARPVLLVGAVAEIEAGDVHPSVDERT